MRAFATALVGGLYTYVGKCTSLTNRRACIFKILPLYSNSSFGVMYSGNGSSSHGFGRHFSKKANHSGNKKSSQNQVWARKSQKPVVVSKTAVDVPELAKSAEEVAESSTEKATVSKKATPAARARVIATFHPKFENEKSDQEIRMKMIQVVAAKQGVLEVSLKHSGSLFIYSGDNTGGAFAKNSYGNLYTAVGVFVLGQTFKEAWGPQAAQKQREFNVYLQENRLCVAMELVTAVLGDHGQRPLQDYVVVTAVTSLEGRPNFYSTPDVIAFCHQWRLQTNQMWLFSTKDSVLNFFSAYDALCEEGIARTVIKVLGQMADLSVPGGTKGHEDLQGEILEGLVARVVDPHSLSNMEKTLLEHPVPKPCEGSINLQPGLRDICAANRESEEKQIKSLLQHVGSSMCSNTADWSDEKSIGAEAQLVGNFLDASPSDHSTLQLQELCRTVRSRKLPVRFKCRPSLHGEHAAMNDDNAKSFRMTIHVLSDSAFRRYQTEMRKHPGLWPLYRGFFVDIDLFHTKDSIPAMVGTVGEKLAEVGLESEGQGDVENLMIKLKFLPYKIRTFLIRNGLPHLLNKGVQEYKSYYLRQLKTWGTSTSKQKELVQLLDEWADYARKTINDKKLHNSYLTVAEPFLEKYAKRSTKNHRLIGAAGSVVNIEQFLAVSGERSDGEEDPVEEDFETAETSLPTDLQALRPEKAKGMLVFFPGIPGCAKSVLCSEIRKVSEFGFQHHLMGDLTKGKYWQLLGEQRKKKPQAITLADKNAPNEDVWKLIESICENSLAIGVPVVTESSGTESNPYSLEALAVFMYRVLQRAEHPGKLDKNSPNPGAVLLMFYNLYNGKDRKEFEEDLVDRFGHFINMPLLRADRDPMPTDILEVIKQGFLLHKKHTSKHKRLETTKGSFKDAWVAWEAQLKDVLNAHKVYLNSIQIPLEESVKSVVEQLRTIFNGDYTMHVPKESEERSFNAIAFVAVKLPKDEVANAIEKVAAETSEFRTYLDGKNWKSSLGTSHVTLAHKNSHGVAAVAAYGSLRASPAPVEITALLYSDKLCALEVLLNAGEEQTIKSLNPWPHVTVWTGQGLKAKDANALPALAEEGQAQRIMFSSPVKITGTVDFM